MATQKDLQDAWAALLRGDEGERDRILAAAKARDRAHEAAKAKGAPFASTRTPLKLERGTDGTYRVAPDRSN